MQKLDILLKVLITVALFAIAGISFLSLNKVGNNEKAELEANLIRSQITANDELIKYNQQALINQADLLTEIRSIKEQLAANPATASATTTTEPALSPDTPVASPTAEAMPVTATEAATPAGETKAATPEVKPTITETKPAASMAPTPTEKPAQIKLKSK